MSSTSVYLDVLRVLIEVFHLKMAPSRALARVLGTVAIPVRSQIRHPVKRRCLASVATTNGEGPLAGIRVLDMTRVLAGVSFFYAGFTA